MLSVDAVGVAGHARSSSTFSKKPATRRQCLGFPKRRHTIIWEHLQRYWQRSANEIMTKKRNFPREKTDNYVGFATIRGVILTRSYNTTGDWKIRFALLRSCIVSPKMKKDYSLIEWRATITTSPYHPRIEVFYTDRIMFFKLPQLDPSSAFRMTSSYSRLTIKNGAGSSFWNSRVRQVASRSIICVWWRLASSHLVFMS